MDRATREYLRWRISEVLIEQAASALRAGDGWCYQCGREIAPGEPIDPFRKFCCRACAQAHASSTKQGYQPTRFGSRWEYWNG